MQKPDKEHSSLVQVALQMGAAIGRVEAASITPMLAEVAGEARLVDAAFAYELKLDGVRIVAEKEGSVVRLFYRSRRDVTGTYPDIAEAVAKLDAERVIIDGEIIALDGEGRPSFEKLQGRMHAKGAVAARLAATDPVAYLVFDVIEVVGLDVRPLPFSSRREIAKLLVSGASSAVSMLEGVDGDGRALFELCRARGFEGVVGKRLASPYRAGERTSDWIKIKHSIEEDFVVVGIVSGERGKIPMGSLELAERLPSGELVARGRVGSGLSERWVKLLLPALRALIVTEPPLALPRDAKRTWVEPKIVVRVRYAEISSSGHLRHPVFIGVRDDDR